VVAAADVVVIPQRDTPVARAQFPMKLTNAMAMAKPILSTRVGDIPHILEHAGYLVSPEAPDEIAKAIAWILPQPILRLRLYLVLAVLRPGRLAVVQDRSRRFCRAGRQRSLRLPAIPVRYAGEDRVRPGSHRSQIFRRERSCHDPQNNTRITHISR
jgi:glycosyltransferase involved in cell wall biosynthesis